MDRRKFLGTAAAAPLFIPRSAWGANDKIQFGLIAAGGRGRYVSTVFEKYGAKCVAIAEVYAPNMDKARTQHPDAKSYVDYNDLLGQQGIDAVLIASPDHHHAPMLYAALKAQKDVYLEKPLSTSLEQSLEMIKAVRRTKQVVQIGMQRRSIDKIHMAKQLIDEGAIGRISLIKPQWHWNFTKPLNNTPLDGNLDWPRFLGSAPKRELEPMRFRYWRYFKDYAGGNMTDQGTHLMDVVQWFTKQGPPSAAQAYGYIFNAKGSEHPDVFSAIFEFPEFMATWTLDYGNSYQDGWSITFMGDKGTLIMREQGFELLGEPWKPTNPPLREEKAQMTAVETHVQNFFDCIKSRKDPNCTVEMAAAAVAGPHLANTAMFSGKKAKLPPGYLQS